MIVKRSLLFWVLLTCVLCLLPSGWLKGLEGTLFPVTRGGSPPALFWRAAKEPLAHGVLIFGVAFSLMRLVSAHLLARPTIGGVNPGLGAGRDGGQAELPSKLVFTEASRKLRPSAVKGPAFLQSRPARACLTVGSVMLMAVLLEVAQALLPTSFSRGYAWGDLGASLVGGVFGTFMALKWIPANPLHTDE